MWEYIINTLLTIPLSVILAYSLTCMISVRRFWLFMILYPVLPALLELLFGGLLSNDLLCNVFVWGVFLGLPILMSGEKLAVKLGAVALCLVSITLSEMLTTLFYRSAGGSIAENTQPDLLAQPELYFLARVIVLACAALCLYLTVLLWNRFVRGRVQKELWWFLLFPASQALLIWFAVLLGSVYAFSPKHYIMLSVFTLIAMAADVALVRAIRQLAEKNAAKQRAEFMESQLENQRRYYERILPDVEAVSKLRHDLRNQLQTAYSLFLNGDTDAAVALLQEFSDQLESKSVYCMNRVVNAVLQEKAALCQKRQIAFDCGVALEEDTPFDMVTLCSVFANLMDNAITAAESLEETEDCSIHLSAGSRGGYFIIKCDNSSAEPPKRKGRTPMARHGWGLTIIEEMASRYSGRLDTRYESSRFYTTVWLKEQAADSCGQDGKNIV